MHTDKPSLKSIPLLLSCHRQAPTAAREGMCRDEDGDHSKLESRFCPEPPASPQLQPPSHAAPGLPHHVTKEKSETQRFSFSVLRLEGQVFDSMLSRILCESRKADSVQGEAEGVVFPGRLFALWI